MTTGSRRLLLISYHFGPDGPTGGFRWNATVRHLRQAGWCCDVVTLAREDLRVDTDEADRPGSVGIFPVAATRGPVRAKQALLDAGRRLRAGFPRRPGPAAAAGPIDPESMFVWSSGFRRALRPRLLHGLDYLGLAVSEWLWSRAAYRQAAELAASRRYDAVVVSSPPHLTHTVGAAIQRRFGVPYVADYRDPWTLGLGRERSYLTDPERWIGGRIEARTLREARAVVHNTERARAAVAAEIELPGRHVAIPNGYDADAPVGAPDADVFRVLYTGHLYGFMDVRPVLAACRGLRERHGLGADDLRIDFVGTLEHTGRVPLAGLADAYGLGDVFTRHPRVSQRAAAEFQQRAALLVAFDWLFPIAVVSKFYEYSRMQGSMLLIGHPDGALADAAAKIDLQVLDPSDAEGISARMESAYQRWQGGAWDGPADRDGVFHRRHANERMLELLESIRAESAAAAPDRRRPPG